MGIQQDSRHKRRKTGGKQKAYRKHRKFLLGRQSAHTKLGETRVRQVRVRGGAIKLRALRLDAGIFSWGSEGISRKSRIISVVYNGANNEFVRTNTLVKGEVLQIEAAPFKLWYESYYGVSIGTKKAAKKDATGKKTTVKGAPAKGPAAKVAAAKKGAAPAKAAAKGAAPAKAAAPAKKGAAPAKAAAKGAAAPAKKEAAAKKGAAAPAKDAKAKDAKAKDTKAKDTKTKDAKATKETKPVKVLARKTASGRVADTGKRDTKTALLKYRRRAVKRVVDPVFEEQFSTGHLLAMISSRPGQTGRIDGYLLEGKELEFYQKKTQKKKSSQK